MAFRVLRQEWWLDPDVQDWSPHKKLLWLYLQTNPKANQLGIYPFFPRYAALETGLELAEINDCLEEFEQAGLIVQNKNTHEIAVLNFISDQITVGGSVMLGYLNRNVKKVKDKGLLDAVRDYNLEHMDELVEADRMTETGRNFINSLIPKDEEGISNNEELITDDGTRKTDDGKGMMDDGKGIIDTVQCTHECTHDRTQNSFSSSPKSDFETVWNLYPRKQGKHQAEQAFKQAIAEGTGVATILAGVERYVKYCDSLKDQNFIKSGGRFFSERGWQDEWKPQLSGMDLLMTKFSVNESAEIFGNSEAPIDTTAEEVEVDEHDEANEDDSCLYGNKRNVRLTQDEYNKLTAVFGERDTLFGINTVGYNLCDDEPNHFDKVYNYLHGYTGKG